MIGGFHAFNSWRHDRPAPSFGHRRRRDRRFEAAAEKGGFLLGNAYRCGVSTKRVDRTGEAIHHLIVAVAYDSTEEAAANSRFTEIFLASAFSSQDGDALIPPCTVVITQFDRFERP
jgi:hypothetical protein